MSTRALAPMEKRVEAELKLHPMQMIAISIQDNIRMINLKEREYTLKVEI